MAEQPESGRRTEQEGQQRVLLLLVQPSFETARL
jgi:hypothetical protein